MTSQDNTGPRRRVLVEATEGRNRDQQQAQLWLFQLEHQENPEKGEARGQSQGRLQDY